MSTVAPATIASSGSDETLSTRVIVEDLYRAQAPRFQGRREAVVLRKLGRIIEATLKLANDKGFAAMSLRDLAAAADMSLGGLYNYFDSKEALVTLIQVHARNAVTRALAQAMQAHASPRQRLHAGIRAHLRMSEALRTWFFFSFMEARHLPAGERRAAVASEAGSDAMFRRAIEAGQRAGQFRACDAAMVSAHLKALLQDWYLKRGKYRRRQISVDDYAASVIDMTERMLTQASP